MWFPDLVGEKRIPFERRVGLIRTPGEKMGERHLFLDWPLEYGKWYVTHKEHAKDSDESWNAFRAFMQERIRAWCDRPPKFDDHVGKKSNPGLG